MDWQETENQIQLLVSKITDEPDVIVAVVRGGLVPARLIAKIMGVKDMYSLTVKKDGLIRKVTSSINENLSGKNVLLVEDALESGASLVTAKEYLESIGAIVKTTSLYIQTDSKTKPDYYLSEKDELPIFPWIDLITGFCYYLSKTFGTVVSRLPSGRPFYFVRLPLGSTDIKSLRSLFLFSLTWT